MSYQDDNNGYDRFDGFVVRIRGLPWSASQDEVANFLSDCNVVDGKAGIHFTYVRDGRPSGEAYIELTTEEDLQKALSKDKANMGKRYIEVFRSKRSEMDWVVKRSGPNQAEGYQDAVVRLRGLPFGCSKEEIAQFFTGLEIVPNGITLLQDGMGRTTGDAYVQFASQDIAERAQSKHKERIGHRYIEIFKSSMQEVRNALNTGMVGGRGGMGGMNRMGGGGGGGGGGSGMGRPGPYDRQERFGGGGMGMGGGNMGFRGRGRGNVKGYYDDYEDDDFSYGGGYGGGYGNRGGMGRRGGMGMGMDNMGGMGGRGGGRYGGMGGGRRDTYESQTGHCVHLRGLPFAATEQDILDFFKPLNPVNVVVHYNNDGRASGEADVDFATHEEAKEAMRKDRGTMQHRYIELFLKSSGSGSGNNSMDSSYNNGGGGGGGGYNQMNQMGGQGMGGGYANNMAGGMGGGNPNYTAF